MKAKKILKVILSICLSLVILGGTLFVGFGVFGTMRTDAGPYGGYESYLARKYEDKFEEIVGTDLSEDDLIRVGTSMKEDGKRNIHAAYTDDAGREYKFVGRRTWYETYNWKSAE